MPIKKKHLKRLNLEFVKGMLETFPRLWRVVATAFYCDKMKIKDIAAVLGCSSNLIRQCLHFVKKIFREKLLEDEESHGKLIFIRSKKISGVFKELFATKEYKMPSALVNPTYAAVCGAIGLVPSAVIPIEHENAKEK